MTLYSVVTGSSYMSKLLDALPQLFGPISLGIPNKSRTQPQIEFFFKKINFANKKHHFRCKVARNVSAFTTHFWKDTIYHRIIKC